MYAWIVPDITSSAVDRPFLYLVPDSLSKDIKIGSAVDIPFGKGDKIRIGYVLDLDENIDENDARLNKNLASMKLKSILSISNKEVSIKENSLKIAKWLKIRYGSSMASAIKTASIGREIAIMHKKKVIELNCTDEQLDEYILSNKKKNNKARLRLCLALKESNKLDYGLIQKELKIQTNVIKALEKADIINIYEVEFKPEYRTDIEALNKIKLSDEQSGVVEGILSYAEEKLTKQEKTVALIHGVTGSGKTAVYMELIDRVVNKGKKAIMLIPEIALTMQNVMRFHKRFGDRVSFIHSGLSKSERHERIQMASNGLIDIMIGPRSAVFTPFDNIGIIIIDEEHETSYNSDRTPRYSAIELAIEIARLNNAFVVLGSATPSVETYYKTQTKEYSCFNLTKRYGEAKMPTIHVVDMRKELLSGNRSMLSFKLAEMIEDRLNKKEQVMLFLNRRGYFGVSSCRACGEVIKCPHCDVAMSLHLGNKLKCHYCGYEIRALDTCPNCNSKYIGSFNSGTQQVEEELHKLFQGARILRMDADTTGRKNSVDTILESFSSKEADILVGTQMIVKGHDFANVTLMGILLADMALNIPDFTASQRCFQQLMQASGRAGRDKLAGDVILQTYQPEHFAIKAAKNNSYTDFYEEEILYRKLLDYPPYSYMLLIIMQSKNEDYLDTAANYMKKYLDLKQDIYKYKVIGPSSPMIAKIKDSYRRFIYLKHPSKDILVKIRLNIEKYIAVNTGYEGIDIQFDYNPS